MKSLEIRSIFLSHFSTCSKTTVFKFFGLTFKLKLPRNLFFNTLASQFLNITCSTVFYEFFTVSFSFQCVFSLPYVSSVPFLICFVLVYCNTTTSYKLQYID